MKLLTIFLFLGLCFHIEAYSFQVPVKSKSTAITKKSASSKNLKRKGKAKKTKRVVIKKDSSSEIDPANTSSPLYNKN